MGVKLTHAHHEHNKASRGRPEVKFRVSDSVEEYIRQQDNVKRPEIVGEKSKTKVKHVPSQHATIE